MASQFNAKDVFNAMKNLKAYQYRTLYDKLQPTHEQFIELVDLCVVHDNVYTLLKLLNIQFKQGYPNPDLIKRALQTLYDNNKIQMILRMCHNFGRFCRRRITCMIKYAIEVLWLNRFYDVSSLLPSDKRAYRMRPCVLRTFAILALDDPTWKERLAELDNLLVENVNAVCTDCGGDWPLEHEFVRQVRVDHDFSSYDVLSRVEWCVQNAHPTVAVYILCMTQNYVKIAELISRLCVHIGFHVPGLSQRIALCIYTGLDSDIFVVVRALITLNDTPKEARELQDIIKAITKKKEWIKYTDHLVDWCLQIGMIQWVVYFCVNAIDNTKMYQVLNTHADTEIVEDIIRGIKDRFSGYPDSKWPLVMHAVERSPKSTTLVCDLMLHAIRGGKTSFLRRLVNICPVFDSHSAFKEWPKSFLDGFIGKRRHSPEKAQEMAMIIVASGLTTHLRDYIISHVFPACRNRGCHSCGACRGGFLPKLLSRDLPTEPSLIKLFLDCGMLPKRSISIMSKDTKLMEKLRAKGRTDFIDLLNTNASNPHTLLNLSKIACSALIGCDSKRDDRLAGLLSNEHMGYFLDGFFFQRL